MDLLRAWRLGPPCTMDGDDPPARVLSPGPMRHPPPAGAFGPGSLKRAAVVHRSLCVGPVPGSATDAAVPPEQMPCQGAPARPWNQSPTCPRPASVPRPPRARISYQRQDGSFGAWHPCGSRSGKRQSGTKHHLPKDHMQEYTFYPLTKLAPLNRFLAFWGCGPKFTTGLRKIQCC